MHGPDVTATRGRGKPPPEADQFASLVLERGALAGQVRRPGPRSETASASFVIQRMTAARVLIAPGTEAATSGNGQRVTAITLIPDAVPPPEWNRRPACPSNDNAVPATSWGA
jgi:hypothetical protein